MYSKGKVFIVGCGALTKNSLTFEAYDALDKSDIIVGYKNYVNKIMEMFPQKIFFSTGMKQELERVEKVIEFASEGKTVSLICSGDAGIYGMAGLFIELIEKKEIGLNYEIIPGVPALAICAARLGAPLMNDFGVISFSNLLTQEKVIEKRLKGLIDSGLVIVIYNPVSKGRKELFERLWDIILEERETFFGGYVKKGGRKDEESGVGRVFDLPSDRFDMSTLIIVGNEYSDIIDGKLVTKRGYNI